jgi:hypothetical protein
MQLECLKRKSLLESFGEQVEDFSMHDLWREFAAAELKGVKFKDEHFLYKSEECSGRCWRSVMNTDEHCWITLGFMTKQEHQLH